MKGGPRVCWRQVRWWFTLLHCCSSLLKLFSFLAWVYVCVFSSLLCAHDFCIVCVSTTAHMHVHMKLKGREGGRFCLHVSLWHETGFFFCFFFCLFKDLVLDVRFFFFLLQILPASNVLKEYCWIVDRAHILLFNHIWCTCSLCDSATASLPFPLFSLLKCKNSIRCKCSTLSLYFSDAPPPPSHPPKKEWD